ncbi:MAG: acyl-CoA dehydrogenase family protein [Brevundimonas sp.]|uniref:acyl-CoA dehydrogenase family protein n=1 Tax=Brevundimonas sp. TaxID=1871086 RepID=UPI0027359071|nr:acyl-CoA dehydrogenase family protein [Brevundimonas sp.]MDP3403472.1 acyl-CoA dehydrogenase family protein [Brevundimonas sp.]
MLQTLSPAIETTTPDILGKVETLLRRATRSVALACTAGGALDGDSLDRRQSDAYELAFAAAELLAARAGVEAAAAGGPLAQALMRTYRAEALQSVAQRLELISLGAPDLASDLNALRGHPEFAAVLKAGQSVEALDETGRLLLEGAEEAGETALDEDKALMRDAFLRFGDEIVRPLAEHIHRQDLTIPESLLNLMREMGVFGLSVPARFGGSAPDDREDNLSMMVVTEALSEASLAAAGSLITRPEIMTRALLAGGTGEQQSRWLPALAQGAPLCGIAITEPDFGSDVAGLALRATRVPGGWTLNGAKTWCTFAGKAGLLMVVARTDPDRSLGHRGLSILLVEKPSYDGHAFDYRQETGGRLSGKAIPTIGYRGMHSFDLAFENLFVPDADVLGGEEGLGRGFYFTMAGMTGGRMQTAARACGVMRAALKAALVYATDRKVFGAPLGSYQLTRAKLARMAARFAASRQLAYSIGRRLDRGEGQMEASLAKLFACRSAEIVTREALQIHGGMGYAEESPVSRYFVDARVLSIFEGAEETLALKVVARSLLQDALAATQA